MKKLTRREFSVGVAAAAVAGAVGGAVAAAKPEKVVWIPDIMYTKHFQILHDDHKTIVWEYMMRWGADLTDMAVYRSDSQQFLDKVREDFEAGRTDDPRPHIQFGGAMYSVPGGDPTFHDRWKRYAAELVTEEDIALYRAFFAASDVARKSDRPDQNVLIGAPFSAHNGQGSIINMWQNTPETKGFQDRAYYVIDECHGILRKHNKIAERYCLERDREGKHTTSGWRA